MIVLLILRPYWEGSSGSDINIFRVGGGMAGRDEGGFSSSPKAGLLNRKKIPFPYYSCKTIPSSHEVSTVRVIQSTVLKSGFKIPQSDGYLRRRTPCHTTNFLSWYRTSPHSDGLSRIRRMFAYRTADYRKTFSVHRIFLFMKILVHRIPRMHSFL
jgi:hypothetical protein